MRVRVREGNGRLFDCAADCKLGKGRIAERTTALLAGSWVRGGGWLHIRTTYCAAG